MIKVFLSSTFSDMHKERDLIQNIVHPSLSEKFSEYGESIQFTDLRWGIETIDENSKALILERCFSDIQECKPFFIAFIGGRYGWIPDESLVSPYQKMFSNNSIFDKSVTELEIMYALQLNKNNIKNCLFYFKNKVDYENNEVERRLNLLKSHIEKMAGSQIRYYDEITDINNEEAFTNSVINDIIDNFGKPSPLIWQEKVSNKQRAKIEETLIEIHSSWIENIKKDDLDLLVLLHPESRMKESLIVNFYKSILTENSSRKSGVSLFKRLFNRPLIHKAIYVNVGVSNEILTIENLLEYLIYEICKQLNVHKVETKDLSYNDLKKEFCYLIQKKSDDIVLYFIISEYDKIINATDSSWIPENTNKVKWVFSINDVNVSESILRTSLKSTIYSTSHLGISLSVDKQIAAFERFSGKSLPSMAKLLLLKESANWDPSLIDIILNSLSHFDGKKIADGDTSKIPQMMEDYIKRIPCEYNNAIIYNLSNDFEKFNKELCKLTFAIMSMLNHGITVKDIENIAIKTGTNWNELEIRRFISYESYILTCYDDRYDLSSVALKNSLKQTYQHLFLSKFSDSVYKYLNELSDNSPLKIDNYWLLSWIQSHVNELMIFYNNLYKTRTNNKILERAFLPLMKSDEASVWFINSIKEIDDISCFANCLTELISIASKYKEENLPFVHNFTEVLHTKGQSDENLHLKFRSYYTLALEKFRVMDYEGFLHSFEQCLELSNLNHSINPPIINYLDDDHQCALASLQDILEDKYGFSFVEDVTALMSKYCDLPSKYRVEKKYAEYHSIVIEVRNSLGMMKAVMPSDALKVKNGEEHYKQQPSWIRGKAIELSKEADKTDDANRKLDLLHEAVDLFNSILAIPEDKIVGKYNESEKVEEFEAQVYLECYRDRALCYERLYEVEPIRSYEYIKRAYNDILSYHRTHNTEQVINDIFRISQMTATAAFEKGDYDLCLDCCYKAYDNFAIIKPNEWYRFFDVNIDDIVKKITVHNEILRKRWIELCKNAINKYQSIDMVRSMCIIVQELYDSVHWYISEYNLYEHLGEYASITEQMAMHMQDILAEDSWDNLYINAKQVLLLNDLTETDILALLNSIYHHSFKCLKEGQKEKALDECKFAIDQYELRLSSSCDAISLKMKLTELMSHIYLETNNVIEAMPYTNAVVDYYKQEYESDKSIANLLSYVNSKLNLVLLWDKMSDSDMKMYLFSTNKDYESCQVLYDIYMLCFNHEVKCEEKGLLMRRIRQTHQIINEKHLGYVATPRALKLVTHFKSMIKDAQADIKEGRRDEFISKMRKVVKAIRNLHYVDIYFEANWFVNVLQMLAEDAWNKGEMEFSSGLYNEAIDIRYELEAESISQDKQQFALLLYNFSVRLLSTQITQENLSKSLSYLSKSDEIFSQIENTLEPDVLIQYASCCFNLGRLMISFTNAPKDVGISDIQKAINITKKLVNTYGLQQYQKDLDIFVNCYNELNLN